MALVLPTLESASAEGDVPLTPRELEVLALLAEGMSNKAIARRLGISVHIAELRDHYCAITGHYTALAKAETVLANGTKLTVEQDLSPPP